jgi:anti-sigma B factor antagonist
MGIAIEIKKAGDINVLEIKGHIISGEEVNEFRKAIDGSIMRGNNKIVADLSTVTRIGPSGIGELLSALNRTKREGGELKLAKPGITVKNDLKISRLDTVFTIYSDIQSAVNSLGLYQITEEGYWYRHAQEPIK